MKPIKGSFCVKVTKGNDAGSWLINLKEGKGSVEFNSDSEYTKTRRLMLYWCTLSNGSYMFESKTYPSIHVQYRSVNAHQQLTIFGQLGFDRVTTF